jgi:hypothetical protein
MSWKEPGHLSVDMSAITDATRCSETLIDLSTWAFAALIAGRFPLRGAGSHRSGTRRPHTDSLGGEWAPDGSGRIQSRRPEYTREGIAAAATARPGLCPVSLCDPPVGELCGRDVCRFMPGWLAAGRPTESEQADVPAGFCFQRPNTGSAAGLVGSRYPSRTPTAAPLACSSWRETIIGSLGFPRIPVF